MALNLNFGGENEYVQAANQAARQRGSGGGASFIGSVLDLLGIHRQVAKPPKEESPEALAAQSEPATVTTPLADAPPVIPPIAPTTSWGRDYIKSLEPLVQVDPDDAFRIR